jgi:MFS family permease
MIRYFGTFKWPSIAVSLPFGVLGTALLIYFRTPSTAVNWLVMCQVFNGISGAVFSSAGQIAVMASVSHSEIAVVVAIYGLFGSIGAAIGQAVSLLTSG